MADGRMQDAGMPVETEESAFDWRGLVLAIRRGNVIPIIGPSLYAADTAIAQQLAAAFGVSAPGTATLREVAEQAMRRNNQRTVRAKVRDLVGDIGAASPTLARLAAIDKFRLFLTTGYDPLLEDALQKARGIPARALSYARRRRPDDLPATDGDASPIVYHLLGTAGDDFAVTEADVLELLHDLMTQGRTEGRAPRLFDELYACDLLFLGCDFPDWLARFFIRTMNEQSFALQDGARRQVIADDRIAGDAGLAMFFRHYNLEVVRGGGAAAFVDELYAQWTASEPAPAPGQVAPARIPDTGQTRVFLSFCSDDRTRVREVADALRAVGVPYFLDEQDLASGVEWDRVIRDNLARSELFVPFISTSTNTAGRRYFWDEWRTAVEVERQEPIGAKFIFPVALDDTPIATAVVPPRFKDLQWFALHQRPIAELVPLLRDAYRERIARKRR